MSEPDLNDTSGTILLNIPTNSIFENETALRPVDEKNVEFVQLADSVAQYGVLEPILVREIAADPKTGDKRYGLINGLQRWTAAKLAKLKTIPANVRSFTDAEVLKMQIITNCLRVETKKASYARQLLRLLVGDNTLTKTDLCGQLNISPKTLDDWLSLGNLNENIGKLVDDRKIPLVSAYALAKLKPAAQEDLLEQAMTLEGKQFVVIADQRARADKAEARKGGTGEPVFTPRPRLQNVGDIKTAMQAPNIRDAIKAKLPAEEQSSFDAGWKAGLAFTLHLDPLSLEADKAKFDAEMRKRAEAKQKKDLERSQKRQDPAVVLGLTTPPATATAN